MNSLTAILRRPPIGWWDLLDIIVVWFLIYEVLKLIRDSRSSREDKMMQRRIEDLENRVAIMRGAGWFAG